MHARAATAGPKCLDMLLQLEVAFGIGNRHGHPIVNALRDRFATENERREVLAPRTVAQATLPALGACAVHQNAHLNWPGEKG